MPPYLIAAAALLLSACAVDYDNVATCEDWVDDFACGDYDPTVTILCEQYEFAACDVSDYFECLTLEGSCEDGTYDASGWVNCDNPCA